MKALFPKFEDYCLPKNNLIVEEGDFSQEIFTTTWWKNRRIHHTIAELVIYEFGDVKEGLILYKVVDGIQSHKIRDTLLRKAADLTLKKAIDVCGADETTNYEMKIIKQEIDVDAVQWNRRSNNDNRGKMQHTARAATSTTTNN